MSVLEIILAMIVGGAASIAGGCLSGLAVGYKKIDTTLAAMMGSFYGALSGVGVIIAVLLLQLFL